MQTIRHTIRNFTKGAVRTIFPRVYKLFHRGSRRRPESINETPRRILILNSAHIGDLVISTSIIPILRSAYPTAKIGFAVGSWSAMVIANHPEVDFVHRVDHWYSNRNNTSFINKLLIYSRSYKATLREIRGIDYDLAICVFPYFYPDLMELAWRAGIPVRLGFRRSLFASMATSAVDVPPSSFLHQSALQAEVLTPLSIDARHIAKRKSSLPPSTEEATLEVSSLFGTVRQSRSRYFVVHMGAGAINREMPLEFWRTIVSQLLQTHVVLFTGKGSREAANIALVTDGLENCLNACDKLSWNGFIAAIRNADALYGVESMAGHVAAAVETPCVVVYSGVAGVARWRPEGSRCTVFTNHLACAPCGNIRGCEAMTCLKEINPSDIVALRPADKA